MMRSMSVQDPRGFNEWLRAQLKAKRMSQRQLAQQAGVDHSTISRLVRGDRTPSLGTATKLARGLREIRDDTDSPAYFGQVGTTTTNPTARVEYALRADEQLSDAHVRQIMEFYLAIRARRTTGMGGISGPRTGDGTPIMFRAARSVPGMATSRMSTGGMTAAGFGPRRSPERT